MPMATNPEIPEIVPEELPRPPDSNHSNPIPVLTNPNPPMTTKPLRQELPRPPDSVPFRPLIQYLSDFQNDLYEMNLL